MSVKTTLKRMALAIVSLPAIVGNALAAKNIDINTFTDGGSDFWAGVDPIKSTIIKLVGIIIVIYGVSLVAGTFGSGIKANIAPLVNNLELRSQGYKGILGVVAALILVSLVLAMCFSIWNDMFSGA